MFAEEGEVEAILGFYCFDIEFKQLHKQGQISVPADVRFSEHKTLASQIPCVLLPSSSSSDAATATKVSKLSSPKSQTSSGACGCDFDAIPLCSCQLRLQVECRAETSSASRCWDYTPPGTISAGVA